MLNPFANIADLIIASSQGIAQHLKEKGVVKNKIAIVYPPIDTQLYKPLNKYTVRAKLGLSKEAKIILYIGNLKSERFPEDKILDLMKTLAKDDPEVLLLVFAPISDLNIKRGHEIRKKAEIQNLTDKVKLSVKNLRETEKANIYSASDVFFFPKSDSGIAVEPPLTALEAMASGVLVFAPIHSAMKEIITSGENGFLFETNDVSILSNNLIRFLNDKTLYLKISRNARQTIINKSSFATAGKELIMLQKNLIE